VVQDAFRTLHRHLATGGSREIFMIDGPARRSARKEMVLDEATRERAVLDKEKFQQSLLCVVMTQFSITRQAVISA
jgi:hypothetical protein